MATEQTIHLEKYSPTAKSLVSSAQALADERKHATVDPLHLLARILEQSDVAKIIQKIGVDLSAIINMVDAALEKLNKSNNNLAFLSSPMLDLLARAEKDATNGNVGIEHLLNSLVCEIRGPAGQILQKFDLAPGSFRPYVAALKQVAPAPTVAPTKPSSQFTRDLIALSGTFGPLIGRDAEVRRLLQVLSRQTKNNPLLVSEPGAGKNAIMEEIARRFDKKEVPDNLVKMAFIELEISALTSGAKVRGEIEDRVREVLAGFKQDNKSVILLIDGIENLINQSSLLNVSDLFKTLLVRNEVRIFGMTTPDGLRKLNEKDLSFARKFTVLTIDPPTPEQAIEIARGVCSRFEKYHGVNITNSAIIAAVNLAKRYVQDKALPDSAIDLLDEASARKRVELTGMPADLDRDVQRLASLKVQRDQLVNDPSAKKTLDKLDQEVADLEPKVSELRSKLDKCKNAVSSVGNLRDEYQRSVAEYEQAKKDRNFQRMGELEHGILPELKKKLEEAENALQGAGVPVDASNVVGDQEIAVVVGDWTGVPVSKMLEEESIKLLQMEERISKRVVGQEEAVEKLSKAIRRSRVGLRDPKKPIGSFLFLGASGCGKTELAKALAEFLFDDENAMTRFDMSEFMERHAAQRMVGSPVGYQGSEDGGELTEAARKRPYSVLLFDEVEKAHPDVFNMLLSVLDDGRLTDGRGRTADFSNTVIIMTSNIGSKRLLDANAEMFETKEGREELREGMLSDLKGFLRPEFINRIDNVLLFKPLTKEGLKGIANIEIRKVEKLLSERELKLVLSEDAKNYLVDTSYQPSFGARPLKRAITEHVQNHLAEALLHKGYKDGSTIRIGLENNEFVFLADGAER